MQQELIEMLEKVVDHVVLCNEYDQRFSSTSYGVSLLKEAEALVEKAKNSAKEPAVPFDEQEAFEREMRSRHGWNNSYFTQSNDGGYLSNRATYAYIGWQARASIEKSAANEPAVPQGEPWYGHKFKEVTRGVWHCECGKTINEGATPCTNGTQSISTMRRDAVNLDATKMHDAGSAAHAGQGQFTRVDGSRSSLRGSGTQDDPFVADNLDDLAAAPTSPLQEPVTDDVPAHVEGLLEHRRELDAIEFFESTNRDSHGFRRSVRGTYVNPAVARDWKWFQLGMQHATKE